MGRRLPIDDSVEEWRPVKGALGYDVSSHGRVRSVDRVIQTKRGPYRLLGKIISGSSRNQLGHIKVPICASPGSRGLYYVHALVLNAFVGRRPSGKEAAHRDGNPANNHWRNLRWATPKQNAKDKRKHGTNLARERHPGAVLTEADIKDIRKRLKRGETQRAISALYGVARTTIQAIANGRSWRERNNA